uniref:Uncharacterized protein n=1 Tax=Coccidioides posadasii RMSCC 3488 TaxID=454284 RepID=A0A0J6I0S9_COCPO|nr:hypothetical protein CPAG_01218 [Coccidioides posadasii RMSCC 3488]
MPRPVCSYGNHHASRLARKSTVQRRDRMASISKIKTGYTPRYFAFFAHQQLLTDPELPICNFCDESDYGPVTPCSEVSREDGSTAEVEEKKRKEKKGHVLLERRE